MSFAGLCSSHQVKRLVETDPRERLDIAQIGERELRGAETHRRAGFAA
jgi:hypothetical protein